MNLIAATSVSDILVLSALVIVTTVWGTILRSASGKVRRLNKIAARSHVGQIDPDIACRVVRSHDRIVQGLLVALMPAVTMVLMITASSLLRDHGFVIFWFPVTLACSFTGLVAWWSSRIQDRLMLNALRSCER
jgi:hypothetical protein